MDDRDLLDEQPVPLQVRLRELGWNAVVDSSGPFYWGHAHPLPSLTQHNKHLRK
jgi:hypothetical protein